MVERVSRGETGLAAVTFDDGYRDCYERAFPILQEKALPFTVFLATGFLQTRQCEWAESYRMLPPLTWSQVREMQRYGADVQCHTHEHRRWSEQSSTAIARDLKTSRRILEDQLGAPVSSFAYPYGQPHDIDGRGARLLPECGFRLGFTTLHTTLNAIPDPFRIPRMSVNGEDTAGDFVQHLRGKRDILAPLERAKSAGIQALSRFVR
jgi:peptidoglycan/xylan/chitin deacetylase (PgdA/CDA1 family)